MTFDVDGPIQAEVFVVWLNGDRLELSGPCGPEPWYIEVNRGDDPVQVEFHNMTATADEVIASLNAAEPSEASSAD